MLVSALAALAFAAAAADGPAPAEPAAVAAVTPSDIPASAPKDDYGFVAWCHGALQGHMDLYDQVKDELNSVSPNAKGDEEQMKAGRDYLALYSRALKAAETYGVGNLRARGVDAETRGRRIWTAARAAEPRTRMWSWLMWELPARCETAAVRLEKDAPLLGQALKRDETEAPSPDVAEAAPAEPGLRGAQ